MRNRNGMLLVQTQQHLRVAVAEQVDKAVVEAAIGGAGVERDIGQIELAQHHRHRVAAPIIARLVGEDRALDARWPDRSVAHAALPAQIAMMVEIALSLRSSQ